MAIHDDPTLGFATRAIHAGQAPDPTTGAVMTPVYYTSTYAQTAPGEHKGFEYSRTHNQTRFALEANLASLEGGSHGFCFASGLAATSTLLQMFDAGTHVIACDDLYGGTFRLFDKVYRRHGLRLQLRRSGRRRGRGRGRAAADDQAGVARDPDQPDAQAVPRCASGPASCSRSTTRS
jgi:cystathionine beta-lyase/cystathionine gamma-synthase